MPAKPVIFDAATRAALLVEKKRQMVPAFELLRTMTGGENLDRLTPAAREAFPDLLEKCEPAGVMSDRQYDWVMNEAERLELTEPVTVNAFSRMAPARQAEHRERAARVVEPAVLVNRPKYPPGDKRNAPIVTEITPCPVCNVEGEAPVNEKYLTCPACGHSWEKEIRSPARHSNHAPDCMCRVCRNELP